MEDKKYDLRAKAKELLRTKKNISNEISKEEFSKLLEEFAIIQIELELQNQELKEAQNQIEFEKERFADLYHNAPIGYLQLNEKGIIIDLNNRAAQILQTETKNALNKPCIKFIRQEHISDFYNHIESIFNKLHPDEDTIKVEIAGKNKQKRIVKLKSNLMHSQHSKLYCRTIVEDITQEQTYQNKIKNLNLRLENSMIAGDMAWWELNLPSGNVVFNKNKVKMLGYEVDNFVHYKDFMDIVHPEDYENTMNAFRKHLKGEVDVYECEYRIKHKNGQYLWFYDIGRITFRNKKNITLNGLVSNITDKKNYEYKLKELNIALKDSNDQLKETNEIISLERNQFISLLDSIPELIYVADKKTYEIVFTNKAMREAMGRDITGEKCYNAIQNNSRECHICKRSKIFETDEPHFWEYHNEILDRHFYIMDRSLKWIDNREVHFEMAVDITKMKKAQNELKKSEEKFRLLVEVSPIGIIEVDENGKVSEWNRQMQLLTGIPKNEVQHKDFWDVAPQLETKETDWERFAKHLKPKIVSALKGEKADWLNKVYEKKIINKNGKIGFGEVVHFRIPGTDGYRIGAVILDVTERKIAEKQLIKSEENLKKLIHNVPLAIFVHRNMEGGKFVLVNEMASKYTGYTMEELLSMNVGDIDIDSVERDDSQIWQQIEEGKYYKLESKHYRKDGSSYPAEINFALIHYQNKPAIIAIVQDITERKKAENLLINLNATKDKFFSIIAHDLKNPFNSIIGFSELMTKNIDRYDKKTIKRFGENINNAAISTLKLLENLLEWSRSQSGKINYNPHLLKLNVIIQDTIGVIKNQADKKEITIENKSGSNIQVLADNNMLNTILRNLISNAIKFTHRNGKVVVSAQTKNNMVEVSVADNGIGMSKQIQDKLFKISEKVTSHGTENETGTGIGLILCKEFVEKHGGSIWVESEKNKGATFTFTIPLYQE